jgi:DNA-directed RNA polymerase specialized sigma24 family protein
MKPLEISTPKIVEIFRFGSKRQKNGLMKLLLAEKSVQNIMLFAINFGCDPIEAQSIMHDAVLALMKSIEQEKFREGNWRNYLITIFKNKTIDEYHRKKNQQLPRLKPHQDFIDSADPEQFPVVPAVEQDYWLQPFGPTNLELDRNQAYELAFELFDRMEPCRRDACSAICRAYIQQDLTHKELLTYLEENNIHWDQNDYSDPQSAENLSLRHQRLRDRLRECWRRLRAYLGRSPQLLNEIFDALNA